MWATIWHADGRPPETIRFPGDYQCGDYCDRCGDCMRCYGWWDGCDHRLVLYDDIEEDAARIAELFASLSTPPTPEAP